MPDGDGRRRQAVHFEQEAAREFARSRIARHIARNIAVEYLTRRVGELADLHLERHVPDMVQAERHQRTFNHAIDTECHNRVLIGCPLRELLNRRANWRPDKGEQHAQHDRRQAGDNRHKALTGEEAEIFRQLDTVEAVEHIGRYRTGDNAAQYAGIRQMVRSNLLSGEMQHQWRDHRHGFHHDAVRHHRRQRGDAVVVGKAERHADSEDKRHISKHRTARFRHHVGNDGRQPAKVCRTNT